MDNAQKAIMIGVGLFITIIIISAVLLIVNLGTGLVDDATAELGSMSTSLQNQILQNYDNKVLTGVQVRSAIQQYIRSTDLTVMLGTITDENKAKCAAIVGAKDFNPGKCIAQISESAEIVMDGSNDLTKEKLDKVSSFEIEATEYNKHDGKDFKETSMAPFNDITNAGEQYIDTSATYRSYMLRIAGTETIVGIVFIPNVK